MVTQEIQKELRRYMGRRMDEKGIIRYQWQIGDETGDIITYKKAAKSPTAVGSVWEFSILPDRTFYVAGEHRPVLTLSARADDPQVIRWLAEDRAAMVEQVARRESAQAVRDGSFEAILAPLRGLYWQERSRTARAAILAAIISEVTAPV